MSDPSNQFFFSKSAFKDLSHEPKIFSLSSLEVIIQVGAYTGGHVEGGGLQGEGVRHAGGGGFGIGTSAQPCLYRTTTGCSALKGLRTSHGRMGCSQAT